MSHTRRDFLKTTLGASALWSLGPAVPALLSRSALAAPEQDLRDTALVLVQLSGGNDGLNTVVPYDDPTYAKSRPTLRMPAGEVHKIDAGLGFHPRMEAFMRLYKEGHLGIVQGVGYPKSSRDHNGAMRDWHTARPEEPNCQTGWLGRAVDHLSEQSAGSVPGVFVGPIAQPFGMNAEKAMVPSVQSIQQYRLQAMPGPGDAEAPWRRLAGTDRRLVPAELPRSAGDNPLMEHLQQSAAAAYAAGKKIEAVARAQAFTAGDAYPDSLLAGQLRTVAQLIRADVGIRIYFTELGGGGIGGFDNHANQRGNHGAVLHQLSESVAAFMDDLERNKLLDRVLLMTFSEFGRTVAENGRRGTDHGAAAPLFLAGGKVKAGLVGEHPSLTDLEGDAQKPHTDFRRVYATVLDRWLGFDSRIVLGEKHEPLDVLGA